MMRRTTRRATRRMMRKRAALPERWEEVTTRRTTRRKKSDEIHRRIPLPWRHRRPNKWRVRQKQMRTPALCRRSAVASYQHKLKTCTGHSWTT